MWKPRHDLESWWVNSMPFAAVENPFELFTAILCIIAGFPLMLGITQSSSVDKILPYWMVIIWGTQLVIGSILVTAGLLRRVMYIEMAGLWQLSSASLVYAIAIAVFAGLSGLLSSAIIFAFSVACWSRLFLLRATMKMLSRSGVRDVL